MFFYNPFLKENFCNSSQFFITKLTHQIIWDVLLGGQFHGQLCAISRITLNSNPEDFTFILQCHQFPIKPCFAITVNKSQSQSFNIVSVDLCTLFFSYGQFYVAMFHVTNVNNLHILLDAKLKSKLQNIVWKQLLLCLPTVKHDSNKSIDIKGEK